jgi:hypothetical protein
MEAALSKLYIVPAMSCPPSEVGFGSTENFSPRVGVSSLSLSDVPSVLSIVEGETIVAAVDLVLQILPELWGALCEPFFASVSGAYEGGIIDDLVYRSAF